jgi:hypothetical protein
MGDDQTISKKKGQNFLPATDVELNTEKKTMQLKIKKYIEREQSSQYQRVKERRGEERRGEEREEKISTRFRLTGQSNKMAYNKATMAAAHATTTITDIGC